MVLMFYLNVISLLFMDKITIQLKVTKISCKEKKIRKRRMFELNFIENRGPI
jgi:hypothetical protein